MCLDYSLKTGVDVGCGCGRYVAQWRKYGLSFAGYDANPFTEELSKLILPKDDEPCGIIDFTKKIRSYDRFDIVVCKDVLPYIPEEKQKCVIENLISLSCRFIVVGWNDDVVLFTDNTIKNYTKINNIFKERGFLVDVSLSSQLRVMMNNKNYKVYIKSNN